MEETMLEEDCFGLLRKDGGHPSEIEPIRRFTISNGKMSIQVITYGAAITSIKVPDKEGNVDDVVLGFDNLQAYLNHQYYFGSTVGRVANRIARGCFKILDQEYRLQTNDGHHHLHGGFKGFDKVVWESHVEGSSVTFTYVSPSWEEGYPGQLTCQVTYELTDENEIIVRYKAAATHLTPISLTNHSYFNLGGHDSGAVYDHIINVNADHYTPVDETLIPTGAIVPVQNTVFDIRQAKRIGDILSHFPGGGIDLNFCINGEIGTERQVVRVCHPRSGRILEVYSTQPGVQIYTGNFLPSDDTLRGKGGAFYKKHGGFCLETQNYPDAVNQPNFPTCIIGAGDLYEHTTSYCFSST